MKKIFTLLIVVVFVCSCSSNNPKVVIQKKLKADTGIDFEVTALEEVSTETYENVIADQIEKFSLNAFFYQRIQSNYTDSVETLAELQQKYAQSLYIVEALTALQKSNTIKMKDIAYTDYMFSAVPKNSSVSISYENAYCSISTKNPKVLGIINGSTSGIHKEAYLAIPGFEAIQKKADAIEPEKKPSDDTQSATQPVTIVDKPVIQ